MPKTNEDFQTEVFFELYAIMKGTTNQETYLTIAQRALLASQAFIGDQEEAKVLIDKVREDWNL